MNGPLRSSCFQLVLTAALADVSAAAALDISGHFVDDARGDTVGERWLNSELGDDTLFPIARAIDYHTHRSYVTVGVPNDGIANDWTIHMTNVSGQAWTNVLFVADAGVTIGNADGTVEDAAAAAGIFTDAFRVDATGINANLLWESDAADGVFSPGEEWEFAVMNFGTGLNSLPPEFITPGLFAGSSPMVGLGGTNASILATAVPEPTTGGLFLVSAMVVLRRRRRRAT